MNIKYRKIIYRFPFVHTACVKWVNLLNSNFYKNISKKMNYDELLDSLKDKYDGKRCFIIGNGPSLNVSDLDMLKEEETFAANLIFRIFDKTQWRPSNYFLIDRYADTNNYLDSADLNRLFIGDYYWRKRGMKNKNAICIRVFRNNGKNNPQFSSDLKKGVFDSYTVTYIMIQVAVFLGFKEIYLLGMDHSYALTYDSTGRVMESVNTVSHFFEDSNPSEVIANIEGMNRAYISAKKYALKHNIKIVNVTRGGKLEWFPRKKLEEVLENE